MSVNESRAAEGDYLRDPITESLWCRWSRDKLRTHHDLDLMTWLAKSGHDVLMYHTLMGLPSTLTPL